MIKDECLSLQIAQRFVFDFKTRVFADLSTLLGLTGV